MTKDAKVSLSKNRLWLVPKIDSNPELVRQRVRLKKLLNERATKNVIIVKKLRGNLSEPLGNGDLIA